MAMPPAQVTPAPTAAIEPWMLVAVLVGLIVGIAAWVLWRRRPGGLERTGTSRLDRDPADTPTGIPDEELLPDEDRVQALLEDNDGRMRQSAIVNETGWSKSKVSMLLSDMEAEEQVSRLRVGRENIVSLPGSEPEATRSPYEE